MFEGGDWDSPRKFVHKLLYICSSSFLSSTNLAQVTERGFQGNACSEEFVVSYRLQMQRPAFSSSVTHKMLSLESRTIRLTFNTLSGVSCNPAPAVSEQTLPRPDPTQNNVCPGLKTLENKSTLLAVVFRRPSLPPSPPKPQRGGRVVDICARQRPPSSCSAARIFTVAPILSVLGRSCSADACRTPPIPPTFSLPGTAILLRRRQTHCFFGDRLPLPPDTARAPP